MRTLSDQMKAVAQSKVLRPIIMIDMMFTSEPLYLWNGNGTLTHSSTDYLGVGDLISIGSISEKTDLTATGVSITLAGIKQSLLTIALAEPYQNRSITIRLGAINESGDLVSNPVIMFQGKMDVMTIQDDGNTATITVQCESKLIQLDRAFVRRYTAEDQKIDFPNDTGLNFMAKIQGIAIPWGISNSASSANGGGGNRREYPMYHR
jgi:hypothetical protein